MRNAVKTQTKKAKKKLEQPVKKILVHTKLWTVGKRCNLILLQYLLKTFLIKLEKKDGLC